MSGKNRVQINWSVLGDTAGAAELADQLKLPYNQSQGAELMPDSEATRFLVQNTNVKLLGLYNTHSGGSPAMKAAVAHDFRDSFRIDVKDDRTMVIQQLGRSVLDEAFRIASAPHMMRAFKTGIQPKLLLEGLGWGTLTGLTRDNNLEPVFYDPYAPTLAPAIREKILQHGPENCPVVLINRPRNPNSKESDRGEIIEIFAMLDDFNSQPNVDITAVIDLPYGYGAPHVTDKQGRYLQTGFEGVLDDTWKTKWIVARTGGKEFGAANIGLAFGAVSANYPLNDLVARTGRNGKGLVNNAQMMANLALILGDPQYHEMKWNNRAALRSKYVDDRKIFSAAFGANAVPGGSNMLSLSEFAHGDLIGRKVTGDRYGTWELRERNQVVEYLAHEHDVAVVSMAYPERPGSAYIRVAQRDMPALFGDGTPSLIKGIDRIRNSPALVLN